MNKIQYLITLYKNRAVVFDNATPMMNWSPFEVRYESLLRLFASDHPFLVILNKIRYNKLIIYLYLI